MATDQPYAWLWGYINCSGKMFACWLWCWGTVMNRYLGKISMHHRFTQGAIECVDGVLKWILSTQTVAHTDTVIRIMVNTKYLPNRGIANEVDGIVSMSTDRKKINETKMEIVSVTYGKNMIIM